MDLSLSESKIIYENRVRVRACGIYFENDKMLLAGHALNGPEISFWYPPGGGIEFGETAADALKENSKKRRD
ncbi:hypothetical protein [Dyadobacter sp. NIV53]|uniref:hypothetical protein n=1 Tax=Dyadobacter sp. NIV53 TaxID=2861765 RepID=UPI00286E3174|nr:hypothetical protein [Dyadobacter sp. NIV53]